MDNRLSEVLKIYATLSRKDVEKFLNTKDKKHITSCLIDILTEYFNDKNSSAVRESVIVSLSGFEPHKQKIGYNGYRKDSVSGRVEQCEAKPVNVNTNNRNAKKLDGGANFTDYSWGRFQRDKQHNPLMIIGGFIDGRLIYIFKFQFNTARNFLERLEQQLQKHFPKGDVSGRYVRSASFGFKHYKECSDLRTDVFITQQELEEYKSYITKNVYLLLEQTISK